MKKETIIKLPARENVPETSIYTKMYTNSELVDTLILVPGGPGNDHSMYDTPTHSIAKSLSAYVNVILFDPRGCGQSQKSSAQYCTLEHYIDDIEGIRKHFKIPPDRCVLFGQSYGSIAALGYAIKYSSKLKKLILIGGAASGEFLKEAKQNLLAIGTPEQIRFAEKLWNGTFTGSPEEVSEYYQIMGPLYSVSFKPGLPTPSITYNVDVLNLGFGKFLKEFDYRSQLSQVTCTTLILWGEDEWILDRKQVDIIHQGIANSELVIFPHCGHLLWIDQWEKFLEKTKEFLTNQDH